MRGYAERKVFMRYETALLREAEVLVQKAPDEMLGEEVRCHELARAVGEILGLEVADGHFGFVEHSWLWVRPPVSQLRPWTLPNILDVYVPGAMPQVQLMHMGHTGLPQRYSPHPIRDLVVRDSVVERLIAAMGAPSPRLQQALPHVRIR